MVKFDLGDTSCGLVTYVARQLAYKLGHKQLRETYCLLREDMYFDYYMEHEEELKELFKGEGWPITM